MPNVANAALERMRRGELALGTVLHQARTPDIAVAMKTCGYDWLFIDIEHNAMTVDTVAQICITALNVGIAPIVRVSEGDYASCLRFLDNGALGLIMPHVETVEQALELVHHCRFPPLGKRSIGGHIPQINLEMRPLAEIKDAISQATMLVAMLESPTGIANAAAIAAIDGIDALMIGTNDLSIEMGIAGQLGHQSIRAAYAEVIAACKQHGKFAGMAGIGDRQLQEDYIRMGMRFVQSGSDMSFMMKAAAESAQYVRSISF